MREFMGDHHRLASSLLVQLEKRRANLAETLVKGEAIDSFEEYRYRTGMIEGLDEAINLCKQVQSQL